MEGETNSELASQNGKVDYKLKGEATSTSTSDEEYHGNECEHHMMTIYAGEDVIKKIMSYFQEVPCSGTILSARGSISRVALNHQVPGTVTYEGRYRILSLEGGYRLIEQNGQPEETHFINTVLTTADGSRTFGGPVADLLIAATKIQVTLMRFPSR